MSGTEMERVRVAQIAAEEKARWKKEKSDRRILCAMPWLFAIRPEWCMGFSYRTVVVANPHLASLDEFLVSKNPAEVWIRTGDALKNPVTQRICRVEVKDYAWVNGIWPEVDQYILDIVVITNQQVRERFVVYEAKSLRELTDLVSGVWTRLRNDFVPVSD